MPRACARELTLTGIINFKANGVGARVAYITAKAKKKTRNIIIFLRFLELELIPKGNEIYGMALTSSTTRKIISMCQLN